jgi:hypothetical protein
MLRMSLHQRPWTTFDPANKDHRAYFTAFLKTRSWKECPVQWIIGDDSQDIVHYISKVLLAYYTTAEFAPKRPRNVVKKPQNSTKTTDKKIVRLKSM